MYIRCCGNGCLGFRSYSDSLFQTPKSKQKASPRRTASRYARCTLATVSIRGHRLRSASRRPPLDVFGSAERRYAPNPLMNTYARPAEGARDQKQDQDQKPKPKPKPAHTIGLSTSGKYWSAARPPSRASLAPTKSKAESKTDQRTPLALHHSTGRALARLQLLILLCPPLREAEWRCSAGGWARSAVRRSRTHREEVVAKQTVGDAPDEYRNEGTPSLSEGPDAGASLFGYFFGV